MNNIEDKSPHILNTSSNLLGLCFVVLTSLKVRGLTDGSIIDECTAVAILMFMTSSLLSFLAIRKVKENGFPYEKIADIIFLLGLFFLFIITMLIIFNFIK
jgi:uncharacterized phage infection (PIP) family protein YhgE